MKNFKLFYALTVFLMLGCNKSEDDTTSPQNGAPEYKGWKLIESEYSNAFPEFLKTNESEGLVEFFSKGDLVTVQYPESEYSTVENEIIRIEAFPFAEGSLDTTIFAKFAEDTVKILGLELDLDDTLNISYIRDYETDFSNLIKEANVLITRNIGEFLSLASEDYIVGIRFYGQNAYCLVREAELGLPDYTNVVYKLDGNLSSLLGSITLETGTPISGFEIVNGELITTKFGGPPSFQVFNLETGQLVQSFTASIPNSDQCCGGIDFIDGQYYLESQWIYHIVDSEFNFISSPSGLGLNIYGIRQLNGFYYTLGWGYLAKFSYDPLVGYDTYVLPEEIGGASNYGAYGPFEHIFDDGNNLWALGRFSRAWEPWAGYTAYKLDLPN